MQTIRKNVFNSNSSSVHTIVISDAGQLDRNWKPDSNGVLEVYTGEFDWGYEDYNDAPSKAAYCLTYIYQECLDAKWDSDSNKVVRHKDPKDCREYLMLKEILMHNTGAKVVEFVPEPSGSCYDWGYIDHQSSDKAAEAFRTCTSLKNFIFNKSSTLTIDNDNH